MKKEKVKFPISVKLILIFSSLVIIVLGLTTYMVSTLVRSNERVQAEENNHTINGRTAETVENAFLSEQRNAAGLLNTIALMKTKETSQDITALLTDYCSRNEETAFLYGPGLPLSFNPSFIQKYPDSKKTVSEWSPECDSIFQSVKNGNIEIQNISSLFKTPLICIFFPYKTAAGTECAYISFSADSLIDTMSTGSFNTSFLINNKGDILIHPDYKLMIAGANMASNEAVKDMLASSLDNSQNLYPDENGEKRFYAYHKIAGSMYVVTSEAEKTVFEMIDRTTYRIVLFSLAVLFLAIIIIRFFSRTLTRPIGDLVWASHEVEKGNFTLDIKPGTKDELGLLTTSFIQMGNGLAERERLKTTFSKFTNRVIADRAMKGELELGGETKTATIFFSDIRSFTAMSEKLEPQEVVSFLNDYMTRMVSCVNKTGGVVDKFIGDSIMAVWGAPDSSGSPEDDAWNSIKTALLMRKELYDFNQKRKNSLPVRIGCGINTGSVVAGQIGSSERMEYTVIGDAVNFASRTESLNKPFATDILITENTYNLIKDKVIVQEMPSVHVKGKSAPVKMFAVINAVGVKGPATIEQLRKFLGVQAPDLDKVDTDAEEKKYKIGK